jgi:hypothetical protein
LPNAASGSFAAQFRNYLGDVNQGLCDLTAPVDSWHTKLERVRGKISGDGVERVSTAELFALLEVSQRKRTAGACRRLATLMRGLGWAPMKVRAFDQRGFGDKVRGYARDARGTG